MMQRLAFARGHLRNPCHVWAIAPASRALAQAILVEVVRGDAHVLIEVGVGTCGITNVPILAKHRHDRFVVFESNPEFERLLNARFPGLEVLNGCASLVGQLPLAATEPVNVVSSLPLLSMRKTGAQKCVTAMLSLLADRPGSCLIQYTYATPHLQPFANIPHGRRWRRVTSVWANLPPATVWSLEQTARGTSIVH